MKLTSQKGFFGIDQRQEMGNNLGIAKNMLNFRVTQSGSITKRQGIRYIWESPDQIDGIYASNIGGEDFVYIASGGWLYKIAVDDENHTHFVVGRIGNGKAMMFEFGGFLYIKTDNDYSKYDGAKIEAVEGYIPTVAINCAANGEGTIYEEINLLTEKRRQLFSGDGTALLYKLAEKNLQSVEAIIVDGAAYTDSHSIDLSKGEISFKSAPEDGINNVEIIYTKAHGEKDKKRIMGCRKSMLFGGNSDGRIFLWGNPHFPNYRFYSQLANGIPSAEYFPINAFTLIGNNKINCIVQQYDKQLIFTENQAFYSYCELREDTLGNIVSSFPVFNLNNGKGSITETSGCVMDNTPVTLCQDGLNRWESTSVPNEKNAVCFSSPIYESVKEILQCKDISLFDFQANREIYLIAQNLAYIYNYGNGSWYIYDDFAGENHFVYGKLLYFSRNGIVYSFGDEQDEELERTAIWESHYITAGNNKGRSDLIKFQADMHISGSPSLRFDFKKSGAQFCASREIEFPQETNRYLRLSLRPAIKRAMPFAIGITENSGGRTTVHGIAITTREKERSSRNGIL